MHWIKMHSLVKDLRSTTLFPLQMVFAFTRVLLPSRIQFHYKNTYSFCIVRNVSFLPYSVISLVEFEVVAKRVVVVTNVWTCDWGLGYFFHLFSFLYSHIHTHMYSKSFSTILSLNYFYYNEKRKTFSIFLSLLAKL